MKSGIFVILLLLISNCKGGDLCGPSTAATEDLDADCVEDGSDNCPLFYNPAQIDSDEDGLGSSCDEDDTDEACGPQIVDGDEVCLMRSLTTGVERILSRFN